MQTHVTNLGSAAPMRGDVVMFVRDAAGGLRRRIEVRNTIVYNGTNAVLRLLAQNSGDPATSTFQIASLAVGTGTAAPLRTDTSLVTSVFVVALLSADRAEALGTSALTITKTLGLGDANGFSLTEAGLLLADGSLFARQIHPVIPKTNAITITYAWTISFTS